jgi:hypothetical protein
LIIVALRLVHPFVLPYRLLTLGEYGAIKLQGKPNESGKDAPILFWNRPRFASLVIAALPASFSIKHFGLDTDQRRTGDKDPH